MKHYIDKCVVEGVAIVGITVINYSYYVKQERSYKSFVIYETLAFLQGIVNKETGCRKHINGFWVVTRVYSADH